MQVGQTRSAVHKILGGGPESDQSYVFPPAPRGESCEYYEGPADRATGYYNAYYWFCYQHKILVSKDSTYN